MEIILLIVAGVVLYYLYNSYADYLKNPYRREEDFKSEYRIEDSPYVQLSDEERLLKSEYGVLACILQCVASVDGEICALERELLRGMLDDIAAEIAGANLDIKAPRETLQRVFDENKEGIEYLANLFGDLTKGEYKKRVKVVEFLFALAYADGVLSDSEREKIIDVAAIFELNNDDFNKIYDDFEEEYAKKVEVSRERALEILGLEAGFSAESLEKAYAKAVQEAKQNVLLTKNLNKNFKDSSLQNLREIDAARRVLAESSKNSPAADSPPQNSAEGLAR